ncbi:MAG: hypothetical protein V1889_00040 [archaeon]
MVLKEELFISISPITYRENKSNILKSQADILQSLKRLHNLNILARQKHDLKKRLHKLTSSVISEIDSIQDKIPTPGIPKTIQRHEIKKIESKESLSKYNDIEDELRLIQEKLRNLNS